MPARPDLTAALARYARRFGGTGTVVTLDDGRAFTAAHCIAAVDGRRGTVIVSTTRQAWRVVRRWSPRGSDLALLEAIGTRGLRRWAARLRLAPRAVLRPGVEVVFYARSGRRFQPRRGVVVSATATRVVADVLSPAGVGAGDSGGPVLAGGVLAGIVIARTGPALSARASSRLVVARLDAGPCRARIDALGRSESG